MPAEMPDQILHLPSLVIKNFRGIDELIIPRLGRVTLLAGKNGVGKSTVLDAVRIYAARARTRVLSEVLLGRDEIVNMIDEDGEEFAAPDWGALFSSRRLSPDQNILIGPNQDSDALQIRVVSLTGENRTTQLELFQSGIFDDEEMVGLEIKFQDAQYTVPTSILHMSLFRNRRLDSLRTRRLLASHEFPNEVLCNTLGPNVPNNVTIEQYLNDVALTPHEDRAVEALNLITVATAERVALVGSDTRGGLQSRRRVLVKVKGNDNPIPLRSLGDGAVRTFAVALALASSNNGLLVIDEAENGIHHSAQASFWKMVLQTAQRNSVQVLATTHSLDCAYAFGQAAKELEDVDGTYYRIQRNGERLRAVEYPESELVIAAEHGIEVR